MGRKKLPPAERIYLNTRIRHPLSARDQVTYDWIQSQKKGKNAGPMAWDLLTRALNGELGEGVQMAFESGDQDEANAALDDLLGAFEW